MTHDPPRARGVALIVLVLLSSVATVAASASAAPPKRCAQLHGKSAVAGPVIRVARLKLAAIAPRGPNSGAEHRSGLFACKLPNGPVHLLATGSEGYFKGQENSPVDRTVVKIGSSAGQLVTVTEAEESLIGESFLTDRVLDAATGRRLYTYLKTSSSVLPSRTSPVRTLLSPTGVLVGLFPLLAANGTQTTEQLVAFTNSKGQVLDTAANGGIPAASITLTTGNTVGWTDAGAAKSATIAPLAASL